MLRQVSIEDIIKVTGAKFSGGDIKNITAVNTLLDAKNTEITFLDNSKYVEQLSKTQAAIVILHEKYAKQSPVPTLVCSNPYLAYAKVCRLFDAAPNATSGIHPTAIVAQSCKLADNISIGAHAVIAEHVELAEGVIIGANCSIQSGCVIGRNAEIKSNAVISYNVRIGENTIIHHGCVIGSDGFGNANDKGTWVKIPHLGTVIIGNDVEIGANTTIDRGALKNTIIEDNVRIDNLVQIAHNVHIGAHTAIAGCVGIAGSAKIGKYCMIGGASGINGHITICDKAVIMGMAMVTNSITKPGLYGSGMGLMPRKDWLRVVTRLRQLDDLFARVKTLEYMSGRGFGKITKKLFSGIAKLSSRLSQLLHLKKNLGK